MKWVPVIWVPDLLGKSRDSYGSSTSLKTTVFDSPLSIRFRNVKCKIIKCFFGKNCKMICFLVTVQVFSKFSQNPYLQTEANNMIGFNNPHSNWESGVFEYLILVEFKFYEIHSK